MIGTAAIVVLLIALITYINGECVNGCNGHGKCTSYDMCICCRNWQGSDCSERVCMFGLAHVDTPKGDLDMSGTITGPDTLVVDNSFAYPYGTTEQFPAMEDTDLQVLTDSAHYYMECSNKGTCNRATGECQCYDGYDGVACQRASCPGYPLSCSGHGTCKTIKQLAAEDYGNIYKLWDKDVTMGCDCDTGYTGPDCSERTCKYGVDPLYLDDVTTVKYSIFDFAVLTNSNIITTPTSPAALFTDGQYEAEHGKWAIRFFDSFGEDWLTEPLVAGASCADVVTALEKLPNNVVPPGETYCTQISFINGTENTFDEAGYYDAQHPFGSLHPYRLFFKLALSEVYTDSSQGELNKYTPVELYLSSNNTDNHKLSGYIYQIKFSGNPGKLRQPQIELYLDGIRPSLVAFDGKGKVITKVWTDGQQGEENDYFADHCDGVSVTIGKAFSTGKTVRTSILTGFTLAEKALLKKCLGNADFDTSNNVEVYNWDYGTKLYPHLIKLVRTVSTYMDGGYYAVLWYDTTEQLDNLVGETDGTFKLLNPFTPPDNFLTDSYDIYTTTGTLAMTSNKSEASFGFASNYIFTVNTTYDILRTNLTSSQYYDGDISCEIGNTNAYKMQYIFHCLNKSDIFTMINWEYPEYNPPKINLYTAERLYTGPYRYNAGARFSNIVGGSGKPYNEMHFMTHMITADLATNWGASVFTNSPSKGIPVFHVYKLFPAAASTYNYVAPCSNRGICDTDSGVCQCFSGYTSDSCSEQASVAC